MKQLVQKILLKIIGLKESPPVAGQPLGYLQATPTSVSVESRTVGNKSS